MSNESRLNAFPYIILPCALILATDSLFGRYMAVIANQNPLVVSGFGYLAATILIIAISLLLIVRSGEPLPSIYPIVTNKYAVMYGIIHISQVATILFQLSLMGAFDATLVARLSIPILIAQALFMGQTKTSSVKLMAIALALIVAVILYASVMPEDLLKAVVATLVMSILWILRGYVARKIPQGKTFKQTLYTIGWTQFTGSILFIAVLFTMGLTPIGNIPSLRFFSFSNWFNEDSVKVLLFGGILIWPMVIFFFIRTPQKAPEAFQMMLALLPVLVLLLEQMASYFGIMPAPRHSLLHYTASFMILGITLLILHQELKPKTQIEGGR